MTESEHVKKKKVKTKGAWLLVVIALLSVVGYVLLQQSGESIADGPETREEVVKRGNILIGFSGDGKAEIPVYNLNFSMNGTLAELHSSPGEVISPGQVVAKLDDAELQKQLALAEINYQRALLSLRQKEENIQLSILSEKLKLDELEQSVTALTEEYNTMFSLAEYYPRQEIENKGDAVEAAQGALETQASRYEMLSSSTVDLELERLAVETAVVNLEAARENLGKTLLVSPLEARVLNIGYRVGESITIVRETNQATSDTSHFMVVTDSDRVEVVVPVSELDLSKVVLEQQVEVLFEAYDNQLFEGTVINIASLPRIDQSGIVTYDVRVTIENAGEQIRSGMTCDVDFILRQEKNVLIIPNRAVRLEDNSQVVTVKNPDGTTEIREVQTGLTDGRQVAVTMGLSQGEVVLVD